MKRCLVVLSLVIFTALVLGCGCEQEQAVEVDLGGVEERIRTIERARTEGPRLEDAEIIVSGGSGLSAPADYEMVEQL